MIVRHLLIHVGLAAAAVLVLLLFGFAWSTALLVGMLAGCVAMAVDHGRHARHGGRGERGDVDRGAAAGAGADPADHDANTTGEFYGDR